MLKAKDYTRTGHKKQDELRLAVPVQLVTITMSIKAAILLYSLGTIYYENFNCLLNCRMNYLP
jgi:hypothetical protein